MTLASKDILSPFDKASILIVGGAGFVGSNLARLLCENKNITKITIVDNLLSAEKRNIPNDERVDFRLGSITDFRILADLKDEYDYIFHLATFHGNQNSIYDIMKDHENNTLTTLKLFERIKDFKRLKKVVYSSAGCSVAKKTFDKAFATTEESPIEVFQDSPYSMSKIFGEFYSNYYYKQFDLPIVRARFQNVYGPGEVLGAGEWRGTYASVWRNVTPTFIYKSLKGYSLPVENEGKASRDFIYVRDICRGLSLCATKGAAGDVYNLGSGKEISILELAKTINEITGNKTELEFLPKRKWDNSGKRFASTKKSEEQLNFKAEYSLYDGLAETISWTKENMAFIEKCIAKHSAHFE